MVPVEKVKQIRKQRAQDQAKAQQAAQTKDMIENTAPAAAGTAQTLAETPTGQGISALDLMLGNSGPPGLQ
jgi:hypothetical protein